MKHAEFDGTDLGLSTRRWRNRLITWSVFGCAIAVLRCLAMAADSSGGSSQELMYEAPKQLTGKIYAAGSDLKTPLFTFQREATRSGTTLKVLREFSYPDGKPAVRQRMVYEGNELVSFEMEELQVDARGAITIRRDPANSAKRIVAFEYTKDVSSQGKRKTAQETLKENLVMDDMIGPFLASHWAALMQGDAVKCRYLSIPRRETVGFTFTKESESTRQGHPVVIIKMEPTSVIIAAIVDPLRFTVEREGQHHILQYVGRTTPKAQDGSKWNDLDAVTVFNWP